MFMKPAIHGNRALSDEGQFSILEDFIKNFLTLYGVAHSVLEYNKIADTIVRQ